MTQYHSFKLHSSRAINKSNVIPVPQSSLPLTTLPPLNNNQAQGHNNQNIVNAVTNDLNEVYSCASQISNQLLVGPSIINAPAAKNNFNSNNNNKISLPSISELDCMIDNTGKMMRVLDDAKHKWFNNNNNNPSSSSPVKQYRAVVSNNPQLISVVKQDGRTTTTTTKRPLKRQRATSSANKKLPSSKKHQNQCHSCKSTETPEWRKGPLGPRTLCNACGLIWTKLCKQQEEDDNSRRKFKNNSSTSSPVIIEDRNTSTFSSNSVISSPSSSTTLSKDNENNNNKKYTLSFLLS